MSNKSYRSNDAGDAQQSAKSHDGLSAGNGLKNVLFISMVITAFALGFYSLLLAYVNTGNVRPLTTEGLSRTATAAETEKIEMALGTLSEKDLVYVVIDSSEIGPDPSIEIAARKAAQTLNDSGLVASIRLMYPRDPDFMTVVAQNGITRFPAVLAVKRKGGIVLVMDDLNEGILLDAYYKVWGKTSSCQEAKSEVY